MNFEWFIKNWDLFDLKWSSIAFVDHLYEFDMAS